MKLAYFSPLNPQPSGIADYSEELLPHLAAGADITLFVDGFQPSSAELISRFHLLDYRRAPEVLRSLADFDAVVYHMGNDHRYHARIFDVMSEHPGVVVLHDFAYQDFFLGLARERGDLNIYLDQVAACCGERERIRAEEFFLRGALPPQVSAPLNFPLNCRLARGAEAIIVHSEWSRARLEEIAPSVPLARINHHITERAATTPPVVKEGDGQKRRVQIASFGLITPDKDIERALRALASLREKHDFHYTLVGAENTYFDVRAIINAYGMNNYVTITGHISLAEFERRIGETDIAINLRERTVGETSGSLCRIMAAGVAAVVSDVGWFGELPDSAVVKIEPGAHSNEFLRAYLERLIEDAALRSALGANARRYALDKHDIRRSAEDYLSFIRETVAARPRRQMLAGLSTELSLLGIDPDRDEDFARGVAAEVSALVPQSLFAVAHADAPPAHSASHFEAATRMSANGGPNARPAASSPTPSETPLSAPPAPTPDSGTAASLEADGGGRGRKLEGVDYKRAAIEYAQKLDAERRHYLSTKPFYNLANKPAKHEGDGMDVETHRHFCDFANVATALALPAGSRLLDVGCGSGWLAEYFARLGYDVTGIDISPDLIQIARERVAAVSYGVDHETALRCRFLVHDAESLPLDEEFDAIICYDSLHHFEDERVIARNLSAMTRYGGALFILEGDRPPEGSATEEELLEVMRCYGTLESPFSPDYLRGLLDEQGFAVVGDYVSVNGLFERDSLEGGRLRVQPPDVNYLLCKKVVAEAERRASAVPDSRAPSALAARFTFPDAWPREVAPGSTTKATLVVENAGDTLWLVGPAERIGSVMLGVRIFDEVGALASERHGMPPLPRALAPGESVSLKFELEAPQAPGLYTLKLDMVVQHVCWFEDRGAAPLVLSFLVL